MNGQSPDEPKYSLAYSDINLRPSNEDAVDMFIECLRATPPAEREMMMENFRSKVCWFCGADDPECLCWQAEQAVPS